MGLILGGSGEPGRMVLLLGNAVKAGDDHVLRHPDVILIQELAHCHCHGVVGADDRLRQTLLQKLLGGSIGRPIPEIPVLQQRGVKGDAELLQSILVHLDPGFGKGIPLESGNKRHPATVMHLEHMAHHLGKGLFVFIQHVVAAGNLLVDADDRHLCLLGTINQLTHCSLIQNGLGQDDQHRQQLHLQHIQNALFPFIPFPVKKQIGIHIIYLYPEAPVTGLPANPLHQIRTGRILDLRKTDSHHRLLIVSHLRSSHRLLHPAKAPPQLLCNPPRTAAKPDASRLRI